jgi:Domain of unknown function (DUF4386)
VRGDATSTANNIAAHELLFRLGIVSDLFCGTILIFLVLALYRLLKGVDQNLAVLMVILGGLLPATIDFLNVLNDAATLVLVRGADFLFRIREASAGCLGHAVPPSAPPGNRSRRDPLGSMAFSLSDPPVQIALPTPIPRRVADHQRLRLSDNELYRLTVTAI